MQVLFYSTTSSCERASRHPPPPPPASGYGSNLLKALPSNIVSSGVSFESIRIFFGPRLFGPSLSLPRFLFIQTHSALVQIRPSLTTSSSCCITMDPTALLALLLSTVPFDLRHVFLMITDPRSLSPFTSLFISSFSIVPHITLTCYSPRVSCLARSFNAYMLPRPFSHLHKPSAYGCCACALFPVWVRNIILCIHVYVSAGMRAIVSAPSHSYSPLPPSAERSFPLVRGLLSYHAGPSIHSMSLKLEFRPSAIGGPVVEIFLLCTLALLSLISSVSQVFLCTQILPAVPVGGAL